MKAYFIEVITPANEHIRRIVGTQAEASAARAELVREHKVRRDDIDTEELYFDTKRPDLLAFLNTLVNTTGKRTTAKLASQKEQA